MTINEISSADWSLSLVNFGEVVQNQSDINQCIQIIVGTTKGSDPLRPTFGCDWEKYIDGPINDTAPNMIREIVDSLTKWEQRIEVTKVEYTIEDEVLKFNILWVLVGNQQKGITQISLDLQPEPDANPAPTSPQLEAPTTLTADYSYPDGLLEWAYPDTAGVTFQIFRGIDGGAKTQVATVVDDVVYADPYLLLDSTYQYQVRAKRGSRVSEFSNEAELETLQNVLEFRANMPENFTLTKTGTAAIIQSAAGVTKVFCVDGDPETITAFYGDDSGDPDINAGITGTLDLSGFTGMRTVRARNQSFTFVPGTWVQHASVSINLSNSITTAARVTALVDSVIIANGGTTTDDGSSYTGSAGNTFASRTLTVGTIELDLGDPENAILYEKIVALGTKGWTITTVTTLCDKQINFNTGDTYFAVTYLKKTRLVYGIDYVAGDPLDISLYDTVGNANTGGATGRLANGLAAVQDYCLNDTNYNAWDIDEPKYIRIFATDTLSSGNESNLRYKAVPTTDRPCGQVENIFGLAAYAVYSVTKLLQSDYTGALVVLRRSTDSQIRAWHPLVNGNLNYSEDPSYDGTATLPSSVSVNLRPVDINGALRSNTTVSYDVQRTGDINTWKGAGTVRVVVILDQSGNGAHISEPNTTYQPKLDLTYKCVTENNASLSETDTSAIASILSRHIGTAPSWASGTNNPKITIFSSNVRLSSSFGTYGGVNLERTATVFQYRTPSNGQLIAGYQGIHKNTSGTTINKMRFTQRKSTVLKTADTISTLETNLRFIVAAGIDNQQSPQRAIYANGIEEVSDSDLYTNFTETNFYISMCSSVYSQNFGSSKNLGTSDVIVYQEKLTSAQIEAVTSLLNS